MHWRLLDRLEFTKGLGFRLGALLSVAILPIGLISLVQTLHVSREADRSAEIALLGRTASAAAGERALLQSALGTADALGPAVLEVVNAADACSEIMRSFIVHSAVYQGAAFVPMDGVSSCTSNGPGADPIDMRPSPAYQKFIAQPQTMITSLSRGTISGRPIVVVMQPLYQDRDLLGYVVVSLSSALLQSTHSVGFGTEGAGILTFNHKGEPLTTDGRPEVEVGDLLPRGATLSSLIERNDSTFVERSNTGERRVFAVVPVVPGLVYALGSWSPRLAGLGGINMSQFTAILIPIALWLVSLAVAYFAVYRLVLRHIRVLRGQMRRFAIGNRDVPPPVLTDAPAEITDVSQTFHNMARILIRDEEAMEAAVAEKTVLLKEVHHRVKNNLQLIASIINMQSRMIEDNDAKRVLRSVQDRVAALATIYRNLYQAEHLDAVEADRLIGDIINQMVNASVDAAIGLRVKTSFQPLTLQPDHAVPLTLLATEAFTNALKYAGKAPGEDHPWVRVTLTRPEKYQAVLEISNSVGQRPEDAAIGEGTGLGSQLIEAFATQLEGKAEFQHDDHVFTLRLPFKVQRINDVDVTDIRNVVLTSAARKGARH
ncbi:HAMP domain-containing protein [Paracoccus sp. M683]|uniref:histidine kinase dimerization/phosphoacceptor domain -containing protein n=1 Tax=Paracoccus sp. M683 TaxID=2594268 RepID=UPI00117F20A5|nr:histidine kinase dimerization/phosphoacceptor domain -containing protein [Paracoccus sp. M683]TRW98796.1 HAMP domain-containing protein [Paracoccus sp. M683]